MIDCGDDLFALVQLGVLLLHDGNYLGNLGPNFRVSGHLTVKVQARNQLDGICFEMSKRQDGVVEIAVVILDA